MKSGPPIHYHELRDTEWVVDHADLEAQGIADLLGCSPHTAYLALRKAGIRKRRAYSPTEAELVTAFFPLYPSSLLSQALGRSSWSILRYGRRHQLQRLNHRYCIPDAHMEASFWAAWQAHILTHLPGWVKAGWIEDLHHIIFAPAELEKSTCTFCPLRAPCDNARELINALNLPLPCMSCMAADLTLKCVCATNWRARINYERHLHSL